MGILGLEDWGVVTRLTKALAVCNMPARRVVTQNSRRDGAANGGDVARLSGQIAVTLT